MKAPLSWLKEYVEIKSSPERLGNRLTEIGLGTEKIEKLKDDVVFDFEITPNRPDLLSIIGIAREIAAIEDKKIKFPKLSDVKKIKPEKTLPLKITTDSSINPRFTGIIVDGITVKESPDWLKERLKKMDQRPINSIVDITNYVMLELGNPIHAFDYEKIKGSIMKVHKTKGGEKFESVDGISYHLPKNAVVISDDEKIIDLCGIKGGKNTGTYEDTKTIFLRVPVELPALIRRTSQSLGLRSEASSIFERGVNKGGTVYALERALSLILEISGGKVASALFDIKEKDFLPWKVELGIPRLSQILGIELKENEVIKILNRLNLEANKTSNDKFSVSVPTYRNDLQIEEDLIEEVARIYGYNNFPKTLPQGQIPVKKIPYFRNYRQEAKIKNVLAACGYSEIYSYSLVSEDTLEENEIKPEDTLRIDNPVSREFEYLRPTLSMNLRKALLQNLPYSDKVNLFELGKVYTGRSIDKYEEKNMIAGISSSKNYAQIKGILHKLFSEMRIKDDPTKYISILEEGIFFEIEYDKLISAALDNVKFNPLPKYPPVIEDITISVKKGVFVEKIIETIKNQSNLIEDVSLKDTYQTNKTFHIIYQNREGNLTTKDVSKIREKIMSSLKGILQD